MAVQVILDAHCRDFQPLLPYSIKVTNIGAIDEGQHKVKVRELQGLQLLQFFKPFGLEVTSWQITRVGRVFIVLRDTGVSSYAQVQSFETFEYLVTCQHSE